MSSLQVENVSGELVVDSRLIAVRLGIQHETFFKTIKKYQSQIEQRFGHLRFEIGTVVNSVGAVNEVKFALLTEPQATVLMTFSRNTPEVIECKLALVEAFEKAKQLLKESDRPSSGLIAGVYTERVKMMIEDVRQLPPGYWCVLHESMQTLLYVETVLKMPVQKADLLDGSIGKRWSTYREGKTWAGDRIKVKYKFPDGIWCNPWAYQMQELGYFRSFLNGEYRDIHLPKYLDGKYGSLVKVED